MFPFGNINILNNNSKKRIMTRINFKECFLIQLLVYTFASGQVYYSKIFKSFENDTSCMLIESSYLPNYKGLKLGDHNGARVDTISAIKLPEEGGDDGAEHPSKIIEIFAENKHLLDKHLKLKCPSNDPYGRPTRSTNDSVDSGTRKAPEIRKIVDSGDPKNRIDVVFMGDGYTAEERDKFFSDIDRFVQEMFEGVTFRSFLPLFNIWAIYVESPESGIGYDGPKNTPFKLYREKGQLRAVFTGNAKYAREVCKLTGPDACDFPSLIGNDNYYGGLGGEFVIFTSSHQTGKIVLRHEMGHNFLSAGEEYDNGYAYYGVNAARSLDSLRWSHWLSGEKQEERSMYRILSYPWVDLHERPVNYTFVSDGKYDRWEVTVSVTAAQDDDALEFILDGEPLPWKSTGSEDREFYTWSGDKGFSRGFHYFAIRAKTRSSNPKVPTMICSIAFHEFGSEGEYHKDNTHVSAYPTWNHWRRKSYRPTNAGCLMRNMTHDRFCPVCQEGMWINFMAKLSLIDEVIVSDNKELDGTRQVSVKILQLGQFRRAQQVRLPGEYMEIKWFKDDVEQTELQNQLDIRALPGSWAVKARFETPEVRKDQYGFLKSAQRFNVF